MTDKDTITLPRELVVQTVRVLSKFYDTWPKERNEAVAALRKALAAEPTKQEPVEWMVYTLDGRLCRETAAILREALAAEQPKQDIEALRREEPT